MRHAEAFYFGYGKPRRHQASASVERLGSDAEVMVYAPLRRRPPAPSEPRKPPKPSIDRQTYKLTAEERERFAIICGACWPMSGFAWKFWEEVAVSRGLDPETVIGSTTDPTSFSALPFGHGKDWCWPMALKCAKPPMLFPHLHAVE